MIHDSTNSLLCISADLPAWFGGHRVSGCFYVSMLVDYIPFHVLDTHSLYIFVFILYISKPIKAWLTDIGS